MDLDSFFSFLYSLLPDATNPFQAMWQVFGRGGWILVVLALIKGLWWLYLQEIRSHYGSKLQYILLSVNVPRMTEQTPKAVENIFSHFTGLLGGGNLIDKYIKGKFQENFACELVSNNGIIRYYIRIPAGLRDVFESAIFAQYPEVEIKEATDYALEVPQTYPNATHDMWGTELCLARPEAFPIRTYISFEHSLTATFKDPLASLLEFLGTLRTGEQIWIQLCLLPVSDAWRKESDAVVKKLIGAKVPAPKPSVLSSVLAIIYEALLAVAHAITGNVLGPKPPAAKVAEAPATLIQHLTPGEKQVVEQIQLKAAKPGFMTKIRVVYVARKEVFSKGRAVVGVLGSFKQLAALQLNEFVPDKYTKTSANYFFVKERVAKRQNKLMKAYAFRSSGRGGKRFVLNTEELATIWHFPLIDTKAPLVAKSESKKGEPPVNLPLSDEFERKDTPEPRRTKEEEEGGGVPQNLPFV